MAVEIANSLVQESKVARTINGYLIPKSGKTSDFSYLRLRNVYSCVIVDKEGKDVIAIAAVMRYSPAQAYCSLAEVEETVRNKLIRLDKSCPFTLGDWDTKENHAGAEMIKCREGVRNPLCEPLYMIHYRHKSRPALDQILETAVEKALGVHNLELRKNVTIDLKGEDMRVWRDRIGFCVSDSREFVEIQLRQGSRLCEFLAHSSVISLEKCQDFTAICDFDRQVSKVDRSEYLSFLGKMNGSQILLARNQVNQEVIGFSITFDGTILCLYAATQEAAELLLKASITESNGKPVTMTIVSGSWIEELCNQHSTVSCKTPVYRYHTTSPPKQINWAYVHILNSGIHIV